jgi:hypothetical protein
MVRTFVRVELEDSGAQRSFLRKMGERGFICTVKGKRTRKALRLPDGLYVIDRTSPVEALELARDAARETNVRARIFCLPVTDDIRFCNLQAA